MRTPTAVLRLRAKFEDKDAAKGLVYPLWIPIFCFSGLLVSIAVTFVQRDQLAAIQIAAVLALVLVPMAYMWFSDWWVPWWLDMISVFTAVAIILSSPADGVGAADAVSWALMFAVSKYAATERFRIAAFTAAIAAGMLAVASSAGHLVGLPLHVTLVALGLVAGAMMYTQARALSAERAALAMEHTSATLAERDRIAREIHDLVAHSLSVTMLHITGARRLLADGDDVDEAIEALRDAERVGRQAMQDIRNTVSSLATDNDPRRPLPSADDLPSLVDRVRDAGLPASYDVHGDVKQLPPALGLGLYRIVQESLTNVAKHAPGSPVHVSLAIGRSDARLTVRSTRTVPHATPDGTGSGITGMTARVSQLGGTLTAGPDGDAWVVESTLPITHGRRAPVRRHPHHQRAHGAEAGTGDDVSAAPRPEESVTQVMLVDDQELVRSGLRRILRRRDGFEIAVECADGAEVPDALAEHDVDVVVMDLRMKGVDGIEATRRLRADTEAPPVLVLTTFDDDEMLSGALRAGAAGFILKDSSAEDLIRAVRTVAEGSSWLDPAVTARVLSRYRESPAVASASTRPEDVTPLTTREQEVLHAIGCGLSNTEIAAALFISELTVKSHIGRVFVKLGLRDRAAAVVYAFDHGIVRPGDEDRLRTLQT